MALEGNNPADIPYWVFLSFRGEDTRHNITSHLYGNLIRTGVKTFMDDGALPRGGTISAELLQAIRGSKICVIVFSENYGNSKWCLDELQEIMERQRNGQVAVIPVFYQVDPSVVRHQNGKFREDFEKHERRYGAETVRKWRTALATAGDVSGFHLEPKMSEEGLVRKIVEVVCKKLQPIVDKMYAIQVPANRLKIVPGKDTDIWTWAFEKNHRISPWWTPNNPEKSASIAEVINEYWLRIAGKYKIRKLRAGWRYEIHFVVKLKQDLEMESLAKLVLKVPGGTSQTNKENLNDKPKDKWVEIKVGEFMAQNRKGKLKFSLYASDDDTLRKKDICVLGARIVPVFFPRLNIYELYDENMQDQASLIW